MCVSCCCCRWAWRTFVFCSWRACFFVAVAARLFSVVGVLFRCCGRAEGLGICCCPFVTRILGHPDPAQGDRKIQSPSWALHCGTLPVRVFLALRISEERAMAAKVFGMFMLSSFLHCPWASSVHFCQDKKLNPSCRLQLKLHLRVLCGDYGTSYLICSTTRIWKALSAKDINLKSETCHRQEEAHSRPSPCCLKQHPIGLAARPVHWAAYGFLIAICGWPGLCAKLCERVVVRLGCDSRRSKVVRLGFCNGPVRAGQSG